ncbi:MAG: DUF87 domain-containing protein [Nitrososphaera sp.]|jgi:hypothetical protein
MQVLYKEGDEIWIILSETEKVRVGDILNIDGIITQIVDIAFANVPGVLEHLLRKSLIPASKVAQEIQPEVKSVLDTLADKKLAVTKIRGRILQDGNASIFRSGIVELPISRARTQPALMDQGQLFDLLGLQFLNSDTSRTLSSEPQNFDIMLDRWGINLITGKKESGKSYFAKKILLRLIRRGIVTIVFDLNSEYVNLWRSDSEEIQPNEYAQNIRILVPRLQAARDNQVPFNIPLHEISYDDFAQIVNIGREQSMYGHLINFWDGHRHQQFDLNDLEQFARGIDIQLARDALLSRIRTARALNLFGPGDIRQTIIQLQERGGGAAVINLSRLNKWERQIIVDVLLRRITDLCESSQINPISLFLEEAQLYVQPPDKFVDLLTRMRHIGIFPTFITNDPTTLPDEVFSQLDNLIAFCFKNENELNHLARTGKVDSKTLDVLKNLQPRQFIAVGSITNEFPIFAEGTPERGVRMGGDTRRLMRH